MLKSHCRKINQDILYTLFVFLSVMFLSACGGGGAPKNHVEGDKSRFKIELFELQPYNIILSARGLVDSSSFVKIVSRTDGEVTMLCKEKGQMVGKGEVLLITEPNGKKYALETAQANLVKVATEHNIERQMVDKGHAASVGFLTSQVALKAAQRDLEMAELAYEHTHVKLPTSGMLGDIAVREGDVVSPGMLLANMVRSDNVVVAVYLSEREIEQVRVGMRADVEFIGSGEVFEGEIRFVDIAAFGLSHTYKVEVILRDSRSFVFREGMFANVKLYTDSMNVYRVPSSAVMLNADGEMGLMVVDNNNIARFRGINIAGQDNDGYFRIGSMGDSESIRVVTYGGLFLKNGSQVE